MRVFRFFILGLLIFSSSHLAGAADETRYPFASGDFYPSDKESLSQIIDGFLAKVPDEKVAGQIVAMIVPHAGYVYSGQTAAYAYKLLEGQSFETVILIGVYHRAQMRGASIWRRGAWKTPLGDVPIDTELAEAILRENKAFGFNQDAHLAEHSIEVQIPFLQKVLKNFKIVPIVMSEPSIEDGQLLAKAIWKHIQGKKVLLVASTDMSHYFPDLVAKKMDRLTLDLIQNKDSEGLIREMNRGHSELCGIAATVTVLEAAKLMGEPNVKVLNYANSGDVTGDWNRVVGYGASVIYLPNSNSAGPLLTKQQGEELLKIARKTVETYVTKGEPPEVKTNDPVLKENRAAFVTLKKNGALRGCIGSLIAEEPLYLTIRDRAVDAASHDPRFQAVGTDELKDLSVEISVLTEPKKIRNTDQIRMGIDGVIVKKDGRSGVFLPKVATDTLWTKEQFLSELCTEKAGLPADCWQDPATQLYTFQSQDFSERE